MSAEMLAKANASTANILANISADQLERSSPCASWQVRDLINHVVGNNVWFEGIARDGEAPERPDNAGPDQTGGDYVKSFRDGSAKAVAAFDAAGDKTVTLPFAQLPASVFVVMAAADQFVHGWDLAKATDQSIDFDRELASHFLEFYSQAIPDEARGPDPVAAFGPVVASSSSDVVDKLVALTGRTP
jgi:uncharacterized protein (TIGR03086 family)